MIQDFLGTADETVAGGLQLIVAAAAGRAQHWRWGNTDDSEWELAEAVREGVRHVWGLLQGSFGGRMHMITEGIDGRFSYWEWNGGWKMIEVLRNADDQGLGDRSGEVSGG